MSTKKAWGGRFEKDLDAEAAKFSASLDVDSRLAKEDLQGSIAHARMLGARGIIPPEDAKRLVTGLEKLLADVDGIAWNERYEDVHMNLEASLTEAIGEAGGMLHTARSRNDQVCTDIRLWMRAATDDVVARLDGLLAALVARAQTSIDVLMPGYTHLQRAQPVRLAHHLLAWAEMLERDRGRLLDARKRANESPLGAGALATTTFAIDRDMTAKELGFDRPTANSLDTVGDRDFVVEAVAALANCAIHLSRISEELVLWSTQEFGFVQMSDAYTTGSSMMPQKKNPDMAELVRGKSGRVIGDLVSLMVLLKGLPLSYNRDLQEDKPPLFDAFDTVRDSLGILTGCIATATFDASRMRAALREGFVDATEVADWLAAHGVPFRDAHHVTGKLVARAVKEKKTLSELPLAAYKEEHAAFDETVFAALDPEVAVERRNVFGGPSRGQVTAQLAAWSKRLSQRAVPSSTPKP